MEVVLDWTREFKDLLALSGEFLDTINMKFNEDGLHIHGIDPSRVLLIDILLPPVLFSKFAVDEEIILSVNSKILKKFLGVAKEKDVTVIHAKPNKPYFKLFFIGGGSYMFRVPLESQEVEEYEYPQFDFNAKAFLLGKGFKRTIKSAGLISDALNFKADSELTFRAENEDTEFEAKFTLEDEDLLDLQVKEPSEAWYPLAYLTEIAKHIDRNSEVQIKFSKDIPLEVIYPIRDEGEAKFLIAPRVEE